MLWSLLFLRVVDYNMVVIKSWYHKPPKKGFVIQMKREEILYGFSSITITETHYIRHPIETDADFVEDPTQATIWSSYEEAEEVREKYSRQSLPFTDLKTFYSTIPLDKCPATQGV